MKRLTSPVARPATLALVVSLTALLLAALAVILNRDAGLLPAGPAAWVAGLSLGVAWLAAVRFLLLDIWGRWLWTGLMLFSLVLAGFAGGVGLGFALTFSAVMLTVRRYRTWRHLPDRRRAIFFGLGLVAVVLLVAAQRLWSLGGEDGAHRLPRHLGAWAVWSLTGFWVLSLFHLAINMRLHFLRLRAKLAVSAVLIGVLPLLLMVGLGLVMLYTTLGGARAARLDNTLDSWREMTARGADLGGALFDTTFVWPADPAVTRPAKTKPGVTVIPAPAWVPDLATGMRRLAAENARISRVTPGSERIVAPDSTEYFLADGRLWLMRWRGLDGDEPAVQAWQLGVRPLRELSEILKAGLDVSSSGARAADGGIVISAGGADAAEDAGDGDSGDTARFGGLNVSYRDSTESRAVFWNKYLFFGGTFREMLMPKGQKVDSKTLFIQLRVGWPDLTGEFLEEQSNVNVAVVVLLAVAVFLWLVVEIFAVFFGVRISEGIVAGVHALHRGTRAVAAGDLETKIEIPNEDEFGDLADSFNEMITAVRHGREIALANDRLTQELATARSIQVRLLPRSEPRLGEFEIAGASIPSREIGGDYYDFLAQGDDTIGIAIGDVSGKGMPAALLMSNLQASLHGQVLHPGSVSSVVSRVNDLLVKSTDPHMFATFFYGVLDATHATFTCTNAGHNPPLLLRSDGTLDELTSGGILLGMVDEQPYIQETVTLAPGEIIVLYTDGITEAVGPSAEEDDPEAMFGEAALHDVLRRNRHLPAAAIKDAILAAVTEHTSGVAQSDDITLVVIRRQG